MSGYERGSGWIDDAGIAGSVGLASRSAKGFRISRHASGLEWQCVCGSAGFIFPLHEAGSDLTQIGVQIR